MDFTRINLFYAKYNICEQCKRYDSILIGVLLPNFKFIFFCNIDHTAYDFNDFITFDKWWNFLTLQKNDVIIYQKYPNSLSNEITFDEFWEMYKSTFNEPNRITHPIWYKNEKSKGDWYKIDHLTIEYQIISFLDDQQNSFADLPFDINL